MAYTTKTDAFRRQVSAAIENSFGKQVWGGIGAYRQPVDKTLEKVLVARELGAQGFILFSYDSAVKKSQVNPDGDYLESLSRSIRGPDLQD